MSRSTAATKKTAPAKPAPPKQTPTTFKEKFASLTALPANTEMITKPAPIVVPETNQDLADLLQNDIETSISKLTTEYRKMVEGIKKHQCIDLKALAEKDTLIAKLTIEKKSAEDALFMVKCELDEAIKTKFSYWKKNKELQDDLERISLTAYDKPNRDPPSAQDPDYLAQRVTGELNAKEANPTAFEYTPLAKSKKRGGKPMPALKNQPPTKVQKSKAIDDLSEQRFREDIIEVSHFDLFGDELPDLELNESQLLPASQN